MEEIFKLLKEYEDHHDIGLAQLMFYSDGSGFVWDVEKDEELIQFDTIKQLLTELKKN